MPPQEDALFCIEGLNCNHTTLNVQWLACFTKTLQCHWSNILALKLILEHCGDRGTYLDLLDTEDEASISTSLCCRSLTTEEGF